MWLSHPDLFSPAATVYCNKFRFLDMSTPACPVIGRAITKTGLVSVSLSGLNERTHKLEFWHGVQVLGYLGWVSISMSEVKGQGHEVNNVHWGHSIDFWEPCRDTNLPKNNLRNTTDVNTTWSVFKAYAVFYYW